MRVGACPGAYDRNDTAPFLYGDTYVIHVYVVDGNGGTWTDSSLNPLAYTRNSEAASVRNATQWIESKAPSGLNVDFNTSFTDSYYYYDATISGTIEDGEVKRRTERKTRRSSGSSQSAGRSTSRSRPRSRSGSGSRDGSSSRSRSRGGSSGGSGQRKRTRS